MPIRHPAAFYRHLRNKGYQNRVNNRNHFRKSGTTRQRESTRSIRPRSAYYKKKVTFTRAQRQSQNRINNRAYYRRQYRNTPAPASIISTAVGKRRYSLGPGASTNAPSPYPASKRRALTGTFSKRQ